jgi:hypothetical protein
MPNGSTGVECLNRFPLSRVNDDNKFAQLDQSTINKQNYQQRSFHMIALNSPRWSELNHAGGSAEDIPALICALAAETKVEFSPTPRDRRENPTNWDEVFDRLSHQGTFYSATYAAFPYLVDIAERDSEAAIQVLLLAGDYCSREQRPIPDDLALDFTLALKRIRNQSMKIVKNADSNDEFTFCRLIRAFGMLRHPRSAHCRSIDNLYEGSGEVEVDSCPNCGNYFSVTLTEAGPISVLRDKRGHTRPETEKQLPCDRADYQDKLTKGQSVLVSSEDPSWHESETLTVLAALASECGDSTLATAILDLSSNVLCPNCEKKFTLIEALEKCT